MIKQFIFLSTLIMGASTFTASAEPLKPLAARSFNLGEQTAVVYFTAADGVCNIVTTVGPNLGYQSKRMQFISSVPVNGAASLSVAGALGITDTPLLDFVCAGDTITTTLRTPEQVAEVR